MGRAAAVLAVAVATGVALVDVGWWLLLGKRGRALASDLDWYFADEHSRLLAMLAQERASREQVA